MGLDGNGLVGRSGFDRRLVRNAVDGQPEHEPEAERESADPVSAAANARVRSRDASYVP
jgi:hypothetical protein